MHSERLKARLRWLLMAACLLVLMPAVQAQSESAPWQPSKPLPDDDDWIRLETGEWLKGRLKKLLDTKLEFDSAKLKLLEFDFDDVKEFRIPRIRSFRFVNFGVCTGTATMRDGIVAIKSYDTVYEFPREDLLLMGAARSGIFSQWTGKLSIGFVGRSGNSDQADYNATAQLSRQTHSTRLDLKYTGNVGSVNGVENINNHNVSALFDVMTWSRFYITVPSINYASDEFQNIDYKHALGIGIGYRLMRGGDVRWRVALGGGYLTTKYISVEAGEEGTEKSSAAVPSTDLEADITRDIELSIHYNVQIGLGGENNIFHRAEGIFSLDVLSDILELDLSITWDRVEDPQTNAEGHVLKKDDFRTSVGIGVQF